MEFFGGMLKYQILFEGMPEFFVGVERRRQ